MCVFVDITLALLAKVLTPQRSFLVKCLVKYKTCKDHINYLSQKKFLNLSKLVVNDILTVLKYIYGLGPVVMSTNDWKNPNN